MANMRVFVGATLVDRDPAATVLRELHEHGIETEFCDYTVFRSLPARYESVCDERMPQCDLALFVIDPSWKGASGLLLTLLRAGRQCDNGTLGRLACLIVDDPEDYVTHHLPPAAERWGLDDLRDFLSAHSSSQ